MELLNKISQFLQKGEDEKVLHLTKDAIQQKIPAKEILDNGLIAGMNLIGELFRKHEIFLPDVLMAAKAMYAGMDELKPILIRDKIPGLGTVVIGTVQGDLHDIGKNLVGIMLKGAGFDVIDLGKNVSPQQFVEKAINAKADVIGMSALLTTTMPVMKTVTELLKKENAGDNIKTIIGGAPLSKEIAENFAADAYAYDAANAVDVVKELVGNQV